MKQAENPQWLEEALGLLFAAQSLCIATKECKELPVGSVISGTSVCRCSICARSRIRTQILSDASVGLHRD